ncbi:MAG TPA: recombinase family protein [Candidatus Dormibacteraeota bacterium]|nr:recombinase family protein [Candidatus Dormibacteraeota bacterium]
MTRDDVKRVLGYVRVSTEEQGRSGLGLDAQRTAIERECQHRGWELVAIYQDVISGKSGGGSDRFKKRPELKAALATLAVRGADALIVSKLDRLSRSTVDFGLILEDAQKQDWAVLALDVGVDTSTPNGEMIAGILMTLAQWERRLIGQRTKAAMQAARRKKIPLGRRRLVSAEVEALIVEMRRGGLTYQKIAERLTAIGQSTPTGAERWNWSSIRRILQRNGETPSGTRNRRAP